MTFENSRSMTFENFCFQNNIEMTGENARIWNAALIAAKQGIKEYGDPYAKSSLKVALAVDGCKAVCDRLIHK